MSEVLCLLARPYDPTSVVNLAGPPVPAGVAAAGAELDFTYSGGEVELPLSDAGFTSAPGDTPAATHFPPRLLSPFNFRAALFEGDEPAGRSKPGFGDIRIENSDGVLDGYMAHGWDGRDIAVWRGDKSAAFSTFARVFAGTSAGIEWSDSELIVRLRDGQQVFEKPIQSLVYGGGGGMDGGADIAGKYRPQAYGRVFNAPAVPVDPVTLLYQVHDRALLAIDAVRDKGIALSAGVDHGNSAALLAASIAAGDFDTCLSEGVFRLGGSPAGTITCDLRGDAAGGYVETTGGLVRRIVTTRLGGESFSDPAELDTAAFAQIEVDQPAAVGFWVGTEPLPTGDVLDRLMTGVGGYWQTGLDGRISLAVLKAPAGAPAVTIAAGEIVASPSIRRRGLLPVWVQRVAWKTAWLAQSPDDLAGGVSAADRATYGAPARYARAQVSTVRTKHRQAREVETAALFALEFDAAAEAARRATLYGARRDIYRVAVARSAWDFAMGQEVAITGFARFGFADPEYFIVVGIEIDVKTARTVLDLWK